MRSLENLPMFLKNVLGFENYRGLGFILGDLFWTHICSCKRATHKKCSACRLAGYCSMECHTDRWAKHKELCDNEVFNRNRIEKQRQSTLNHLVKQFSNDSVPVSFEVFQQELTDAVFVACCPIIEKTDVLDLLLNASFEDYPKSMWLPEILSLKKKQYGKMAKNLSVMKILRQMTATWGENMELGIPYGSYHDIE